MSLEPISFYLKEPVSAASDKPGETKDGGASTPKKASFYAKDPAPFTSDTSKSTKKKYMGEERRRGNRRKGQSRRNDVRFDLTKTDRRQSDGRRELDATVKFW
jgi:hypothetical protein